MLQFFNYCFQFLKYPPKISVGRTFKYVRFILDQAVNQFPPEINPELYGEHKIKRHLSELC